MEAFRTGRRVTVKWAPEDVEKLLVFDPSPARPETPIGTVDALNNEKLLPKEKSQRPVPVPAMGKGTVAIPVAVVEGFNYRTVADELVPSHAGQRIPVGKVAI